MSHYVGDDCLPDGHRGEVTVTTEDLALDQLVEMDADDRLSYDELTSMLTRYVELDALLRPMKEEMESIKAVLKAYIEEYGEPVTIEGWAATVREKNKPAEIDLISAAQKQSNDEHIVRAASMGLLSARLTALRQQSGKAECADILLGYLMPSGVTTELRIERVS